MERVKLKHFARPDMVSDPEWGQAMEVAVRYVEKKINRLNHCGALDESVFGISAAEHFVFRAFDKLFTGEWEWSERRAIHTQLVKIALSDISHHLRDWKKKKHVQIVEFDERIADHLTDDEDFLDIVYEIAEKAADGDKVLLDYLKAMRRCDDYELIGEELGIEIREVYQRQRKLMRRLEKRKLLKKKNQIEIK